MEYIPSKTISMEKSKYLPNITCPALKEQRMSAGFGKPLLNTLKLLSPIWKAD
jgi:hypothetical protein